MRSGYPGARDACIPRPAHLLLAVRPQVSDFMVLSFPCAKRGDAGEPSGCVDSERRSLAQHQGSECFILTKLVAPQVQGTITEVSLPGRRLAV